MSGIESALRLLVERQAALIRAQRALVGACAGDYGCHRILKQYLRDQRDRLFRLPEQPDPASPPTRLAAAALEAIINQARPMLSPGNIVDQPYSNMAECLASNAPATAASFFLAMEGMADQGLRGAAFRQRIDAITQHSVTRSRQLLSADLLAMPPGPPPISRDLGPPAAEPAPAPSQHSAPAAAAQRANGHRREWRRGPNRREASGAGAWEPEDFTFVAEARSRGFALDRRGDTPFARFARARPTTVKATVQQFLDENARPTRPSDEAFYSFLAKFAAMMTELAPIEVTVCDTSAASTGSLSAKITDEAFLRCMPRCMDEAYAEALYAMNGRHFSDRMVRCHVREAFDNDGLAHLQRGQPCFAWMPIMDGTYKGGFGRTCDLRDHELLIPGYDGMPLYARIQSEPILGKSSERPLLRAVAWTLTNGMQPPPTTSCPTPGCAGFWRSDKGPWNICRPRLLIPGWTATVKHNRHAVNAPLRDCLAIWPAPLITIYGLGERALKNSPRRARSNLTRFWATANADDLRRGRAARDPAARVRADADEEKTEEKTQ